MTRNEFHDRDPPGEGTPDDGFLEPPLVGSAISLLSDYAAFGWIGRTLGPYRLTEWVASGGMGIVLKAVRKDDESASPVAVKVIRHGDDPLGLIRGLEREARALGQLDHPGIARLLDFGVADETVPYLVLEYLEGLPLNRYCDENRLSINERLRILLPLCDAAQFAHRNLTVHRDIKPSNILVTSEGKPRLLDFGIARLLTPDPQDALPTQTDPALRHITLHYASPEVIRGEPACTAMDVYSLGVVLCELLTGMKPFEFATGAWYEMQRIFLETDPRPPSELIRAALEQAAGVGTRTGVDVGALAGRRRTSASELIRALRGDLDTITLTAIHRDPRRRYSSVEALAQDINRFLGGRPILARKESLAYRARKFVRRHTLATVATGLALAALAVAAVGITTGLVAARREALRAEQEAENARRVSRVLRDMLAAANPEEGFPHLTVRDLLDRTAERMGTDPALTGLDSSILAALHATIGAAYLNLGLPERSEFHLAEAARTHRSPDGAAAGASGELLFDLGRLYSLTGRYAEAESALRRARDAAAGSTDGRNLVGRATCELARALREQGDLEASERLLREWARTCRADSVDDPVHSQGLVELGLTLAQRAKFDEAQAACGTALGMDRARYGEEHVSVSRDLRCLAVVLQQRGDAAESEATYRQALELDRRLLGPEHPNVARILNNLALLVERDENRVNEAMQLVAEALRIRRKLFGNNHTAVAATLNNLSGLLSAEAAEAPLRESLAIWQSNFGNSHPQTAVTMQNLALSLKEQGKLDEAEPMYRHAIELLRATGQEKDLVTSHALLGLGRIRLQRGDREEAERVFRDCLAIRSARLPPGDPKVIEAQAALSDCLAIAPAP